MEYQPGIISVCKNCGKHNFYIDVLLLDSSISPKTIEEGYRLWIDNRKDLPPNTCCRVCKHEQTDKEPISGIRFACSKCGETNIQAVEPNEIINDDEQIIKVYFHEENEVSCNFCDMVYVKCVTDYEPGTPDFWMRFHLKWLVIM